MIRATPAMKVCDRTRLSFLPNTSLLPGCAVVCTPTGIGKVRGSTTVSETALTTKNQSSPVEAEEARRPAARAALLAPLRLLLRGGDADRPVALVGVLVVGIEPALLRHAESSRSAASGRGPGSGRSGRPRAAAPGSRRDCPGRRGPRARAAARRGGGGLPRRGWWGGGLPRGAERPAARAAPPRHPGESRDPGTGLDPPN